MKVNLDFYKGKDEYSDGDIEQTIIDYIKKHPDDYEDAFELDDSWPVFYHLSEARRNVISWYPFKKNETILEIGAGMGAITGELCDKLKKVTSVELSKRRTSAIIERNKDRNNLEIIIGNFKDIIIKEKYDYILLNGVLEYGNLYMNSDNPYVDFIDKLKNNLKPKGKILIAIENKFGLKYWCGSNEDHTGLIFDGINNYKISDKIRTFSKHELEKLAEQCSMTINFYYMFPDYKFPEIILTDEYLQRNVYAGYTPYYCKKMNLLINEKNLYDEIFKNKTIPFFANSFFIEMSTKPCKKEIEFVKFNKYRNHETSLCTYLTKNQFYKKKLFPEGDSLLQSIVEINKKMKEENIESLEVFEENNEIFTKNVTYITLSEKMDKYYSSKDYESIINEYEKFFNYIKSIYTYVHPMKTIFDEYQMNIDNEKKNMLNFVQNGLIDMIPSNTFVDEDK